jgi:hypothetical protein
MHQQWLSTVKMPTFITPDTMESRKITGRDKKKNSSAE